MNVLTLLANIGKRILATETPFFIGEAQALGQMIVSAVKILSDTSISHDEEIRLLKLDIVAFQTMVENAKSQGAQIASEAIGIITEALGDEVTTSLGLK